MDTDEDFTMIYTANDQLIERHKDAQIVPTLGIVDLRRGPNTRATWYMC